MPEVVEPLGGVEPGPGVVAALVIGVLRRVDQAGLQTCADIYIVLCGGAFGARLRPGQRSPAERQRRMVITGKPQGVLKG